MKKKIHPKYYDNAVITCACGAKFEVGSTVKKARIEICSSCHPLYTGKAKLVDTAGRVDRFKERLKKAKAKQKTTSKSTPKKTKKKK